MFDKRRFTRVPVDFDVEIYSQTKVLIGKGKAVDISVSGMGVVQSLAAAFGMGREIFVTFTLPDGSAFDRIRAEVRGTEAYKDKGKLLKLRFTEMKVLDAMKAYIEKLPQG
jgi:c-di-GMP-binding flagellar brake protein YcgR